MKCFFHKLSIWWFATMTPERAPLTTIQARETMRKRRLLSSILLISFTTVFFFTIRGIFFGTPEELLPNLFGDCSVLFAIWINRQGYLKWASSLYLLAQSLGIALLILNISLGFPILAFYAWPMLLILPVASGLFLPMWGPLLIAIIEDVFLYWFMLYARHDQIAFYLKIPGIQTIPLFFACVITTSIGIFSAVHTWTTTRAVIQADRAVELEQAHHALTEAHTNLETAYEELEVAHATIQKQALTDPLTGLPNHRAIMKHLEKEVGRTQRFAHSFSLLFFDLDHFKTLNDSYGHAGGDVALHSLGQLLAEELRNLDTVGRWGGEEFIAILPETTMQEAQDIAERLRQRVNQHTFAIGGGLHLTCSIGIANYPKHATTLTTLINAADQAMYAAKRLGRNQVRVIDEAVVKMVLASEEGEGDREGVALYGFIEALTSLLDQRDISLGKHSYDVADLVYQLSLKLGVSGSEAQMIKMAGKLHDIGKIGISDTILHKPASLTEEEWQKMKDHTITGAAIVAHIPALRPLASVIRAHHERWDGHGYPDRLQDTAIPLAARIISVVDAYMAMIVDRSYQKARPTQEAVAELRRCSGTQFDPAVVEALIGYLQEQALLSRENVAPPVPARHV